MRMGDEGPREKIEVISTGSLTLDQALGIGGLPKGRVVEIYGPESSGKTTLTLQVIAECQKLGGTAAFIDAEHALDPDYAEKIGVNIDNLLLSQPDTGEQALEITDMLISSSAIDIIVIDSVAALTPRAEIEGEMGSSHMGLQARLMSQALRKLTSSIKKSNTLVIFINQIRLKIGVMFGNPETTTGGNALKFYSSVRLDIRRTGAIKKGDEILGNETRVKVVKNKVAPPFKVAEFEIRYGEGICKVAEIIDLGVEHKIVEKAGSWYSYDGNKIGQGKDNAMSFLKDNPDVFQTIENQLYEIISPSESKKETNGKTLKKDKKKRRMSDFDKCLASAQRSLAMREHSKFQIKNKLINKGFDINTIIEVLNELDDSGFQSDQRYTKEYIRFRQNIGYGTKKIIYELKSNGITKELINDNLNQFNDDYEVLFEFAQMKISNKNLEDQKILMKYVNHFKSRGFNDNVILKVIEKIREDET